MHMKEGRRSKQLPEVGRSRKLGVTVASEFKAGIDQESKTGSNFIRRKQQPELCKVNLILMQVL